MSDDFEQRLGNKEAFASFAKAVGKLEKSAQLDTTDMKKISELSKSIESFEQDLRTRYADVFEEKEIIFSAEVYAIFKEASGMEAGNSGADRVCLALIDFFITNPEKYHSIEEIAVRAGIKTISVAGTKFYVERTIFGRECSAFNFEAKRTVGWRLQKKQSE